MNSILSKRATKIDSLNEFGKIKPSSHVGGASQDVIVLHYTTHQPITQLYMNFII